MPAQTDGASTQLLATTEGCEDVREAAVWALGRRGGRDLAPTLEALLSREQNEIVAETIAESLETLRSR